MPSRRGRRARIARREERYWVDDDDEEFERSYKENVMAQVIAVKAIAASAGDERRTESRQESAGNAPHRYVDTDSTAQSGGVAASGTVARDGCIVAVLGGTGISATLTRAQIISMFGGITTLGRAIGAFQTTEFPSLSLSTVSPLLAAIDGWTDSAKIADARSIRWEPQLILAGIATRGSGDSPVPGSGRLAIVSRVVTGGVSLSALKGNESVSFDFGVAAASGGVIGNVTLSGYEETFTDDLWGEMDANNNAHLANNETFVFKEGWNSNTWQNEMITARPSGLYNRWQPKNSIIKFDLTDY